MSLVNLQKKIGVTADGAFGPGTLKAACTFYKLNRNRGAHNQLEAGLFTKRQNGNLGIAVKKHERNLESGQPVAH